MSTYDPRIERIIAEATTPKPAEPRADAAWFIADAVKRYGLPPEAATQITATTPGQIKRQARRLAVEYATAAQAQAEREPEAEPVRRALVPGHAVWHDYTPEIDVDAVIRVARRDND